MRYTVRNIGAGPRLVRPSGDPPRLLEAGHQVTAEFADGEVAAMRRPGRGLDVAEKEQATAAADEPEPARAWEAVHRGRGSYSVMSGDDELAQHLTKDEAETFNGMSVEEQQAWLAQRSAED